MLYECEGYKYKDKDQEKKFGLIEAKSARKNPLFMTYIFKTYLLSVIKLSPIYKNFGPSFGQEIIFKQNTSKISWDKVAKGMLG